jgi:hypothetical protein
MAASVPEKYPLTGKRIFFFFSAYFIVYLILAVLSQGTYETGDSINHYLISKYSFLHNELFLNHWGKPFFTLISSPFSQFGFVGIKIFNIICGAVALYFTFKICNILEIENRFLAFAFLLFTPVYSRCLLSGLTEPLFSVVLMTGAYLFLKKKFISGSLLFSLLALIRMEGFFLLPIPFFYLLSQKQFRSMVFLFAGTIIYSIIGYFALNDFLWIAHQNPYKGAETVYGHGGRLHFLTHYNAIWGLTVFIFFLTGIFAEGKFFFNKPETINPTLKRDKIFLYSFFFLYLFAHAVFWWKGLFGSIGTVRVMGAVMPIGSILALEGYNFLSKTVFKKIGGWFHWIALAALLIWFIGNKIVPVRMSTEEKVVKKASDWIAGSHLDQNKMYYFYPWISVLLNRDVFDKSQNEEPWGFTNRSYSEGIPKGSLLIWDSHFSANEGRIGKESILSDTNYTLLKEFKSELLWTDLDKSKKYFEVLVFQKL